LRDVKVKCVECGIRDTKKSMMVNVGTEKTPTWVHPNCLDSWNKKKEKTRKKLEEWDKLYQTVRDIHGLEVLSREMVIILQDLNNGKYISRRYGVQKKGIPYEIIREAYEMSMPDIEYYKATRRFDSVLSEFKYCLEIVIGNINEVYRRRKQKQVEEAQQIAYMNTMIGFEDRSRKPVKPKKKEDKRDISRFLD
jgi:hypothetical protein